MHYCRYCGKELKDGEECDCIQRKNKNQYNKNVINQDQDLWHERLYEVLSKITSFGSLLLGIIGCLTPYGLLPSILAIVFYCISTSTTIALDNIGKKIALAGVILGIIGTMIWFFVGSITAQQLNPDNLFSFMYM